MKFNWKELLDSFNREMTLPDMIELYKALFAYEVGIVSINEEIEKVVTEYTEKFFKGTIPSFEEVVAEIECTLEDYVK